jgi:hypothetical protein
VKIGLIVDGRSEQEALPELYPRLRTPHQILKPVPEKIQPHAPPEQTAILVARRCRILAAQGIDLVVVLLDRETRDDCPEAFASHLQALIVRRLAPRPIPVTVVMKDRALENWLVADIGCLARAPGMFAGAGRVARAIPSGNADGVDALEILRRACGPRGNYDKVGGAVTICTYLDPGRAALNSRSFRRFLRVLGDSRYTEQSRLPHRDA